MGICYVGRWGNSRFTQYTGVFADGTKIPAIVRISVMLGDVERGSRRTLGMGVKVFPPRGGAENRSYNLLVMDSNFRTTGDHTARAVLDNHPDYGGLPNLGVIGTALRIRRDPNAVDKALSPAGPGLALSWGQPSCGCWNSFRHDSSLAALGAPADGARDARRRCRRFS